MFKFFRRTKKTSGLKLIDGLKFEKVKPHYQAFFNEIDSLLKDEGLENIYNIEYDFIPIFKFEGLLPVLMSKTISKKNSKTLDIKSFSVLFCTTKQLEILTQNKHTPIYTSLYHYYFDTLSFSKIDFLCIADTNEVIWLTKKRSKRLLI